VVTRQLQAERRTGSVRRPKTDVLPTVLRYDDDDYDDADADDAGELSSLLDDSSDDEVKQQRKLV